MVSESGASSSPVQLDQDGNPTTKSMAQYVRENSDEDGVITINLDPPTMTHEEEMALLADVPRAPRAPKWGP